MSKKKLIQLEKTNAKLAKELLRREHELKIESSLEKVRVMAMAMKQRDDMLKICRAISNQLKLLGVKEIRNVQTAIFYQEKGTYMNYEYYTKHRKALITETSYGTVKLERDFAKKMLKGKGESFFSHITGEQLKEWLNYQKTTNVFIDKYLETASSLNYYWFSLGPVALGISTYHPLTKNELTLFRRFVNVFELAYRRYSDIENAEAQAREALIQASLEKVRAGSLAMRKSDELIEAGELLLQELRRLGIECLSSGYVVIDEEEKMGWTYAPNPATGKISDPLGLTHAATKEMRKVLSSWEKKEPLSIVEMDEQETIAHQTFVAENGMLKNGMNSNWITAEQLIALSPKRLLLQNFNFDQGYLMIVGGNRLNEKQTELMLRFTKVFQQTYTRFLDLQKAEAQAREAQIEAALERVRSRSMGMQKSEELKEVIKIVYDQFIYLNIHIDHAGFVVDYIPMGDWHFWIADKQDIPAKISTPYFDSVWANDFNEAKEKGLDFFPTRLNFEEKNKFYQELLSFVPDLPEVSKNFYLNCPGLAVSTALSESVSLYIENFAGIPYSDEENKILIRFGKVFQQTYTRFLDLQKAEAQAREAQIEAALERVRSRSMGMQKTDELKEIIQVIYTQLVHLNMPVDQAGFVMDYKETDGWNIWIADQIGVPSKSYIPYFDSPQWIRFNEAKQKGQDSFTSSLTFDEKNQFFQMIFKYVSGVPEEVKAFVYSTPGFATSNA
ncbi:MAG TPA: hypothetical protein VFI33_00985, partial [Puia sp.]|nr:hypothetical protein [Puia sp.]